MAELWLVICHEATNSGAPRVLLEVLRGVKAARGQAWGCEILVCRGGVLLPEFAQLGPVEVLSHPLAARRTLLGGLFRKFVDRPWIQPWRFAAWLKRHEGQVFDLVYNNTATNGAIVPGVRGLGSPVVTHAHELGGVLRRLVSPTALALTLKNTDHFLAVSSATAEDLKELGVPAADITVTPNFLPVLPPRPDAFRRAALRQGLGLPTESSILTGCGYVHSIKGPDIFVELAAAVARSTQRPVLFVWIGAETDVRLARRVRQTVRNLGLEGVVRFVGAVQDPTPWFAASDVVTVTSRVENFSLVALEAAALSRPVVAFSAARGLAELLGDTPQLLIDGVDVAAMASVVIELLQEPAKAGAVGERLRSKVAAEFLRGPRIESLLMLTDRLRRDHAKQSAARFER